MRRNGMEIKEDYTNHDMGRYCASYVKQVTEEVQSVLCEPANVFAGGESRKDGVAFDEIFPNYHITGTRLCVPTSKLDEEAFDYLMKLLNIYGVLIKEMLKLHNLEIIVKKNIIEFPWFKNTHFELLTTGRILIAKICNTAIRRPGITRIPKRGEILFKTCQDFLNYLGMDKTQFSSEREQLLRGIHHFATVKSENCRVKVTYPTEYLLDDDGNEYWVDTSGKEHYTRNEG